MKNLREALGAPQMGWLLAVLGTVIRQSKVGAEYLHPSGWKGHDLGPLRTRRRIPNHLRWARYPLLGVQTYLAGAHGQRRIPGQSVNLAHLIWRKPCAPVPLLLYPRWFSTRGYSCCSPLRWGEQPCLRGCVFCPVGLIAHHGVELGDEFSHEGVEGDHFGFGVGDEPVEEGFGRFVAALGGHRSKIEDVSRSHASS